MLKAGSVDMKPRPGEGTANQHITDLWLYVNGKFQGAFPVGKTMPIAGNDKPVEIIVMPGIVNNGISSTRVPWNLLKSITLDTFVTSGVTVTRPFTFQYDTNVTFPLMDDFEGTVGQNFTKSAGSDTTFAYASPDESFEGRSIKLTLEGNQMVAQIESTGAGFALPSGNSNVYLELNYKCNHDFMVGLIDADGLRRPALGINPKEEWNKIYIRLAEAVGIPQASAKYKLYFRMERGVSEGSIWVLLDNIKVLYL